AYNVTFNCKIIQRTKELSRHVKKLLTICFGLLCGAFSPTIGLP
ncbi:MAG: hypothetical protein ACI9Z7_000347, partial [Alteromonas macleodii]